MSLSGPLWEDGVVPRFAILGFSSCTEGSGGGLSHRGLDSAGEGTNASTGNPAIRTGLGDKDLRRLDGDPVTTIAEERDEILQLLYRYNHTIDGGDSEGWAETWTPDGVFEGVLPDGAVLTGREELVEFATSVRGMKPVSEPCHRRRW